MNLGIGIFGVGGLGYLQARTYVENEDVVLRCAADVSAEARTLFETEFDAPAYESYRTLLDEHADEIDAVAIVTPHTLHYEQAVACLERDLHVLVEKPMVTDVGHAIDLIRRAEERGLVLQVGYQRRFHRGFEEVRRIVSEGWIGEVHMVNCYLGQNWYEPHRDTWRTDPALSGGGQLYDSGSHLLDTLLWVTDADPRSVAAGIDYVEPDVDVNTALALTMDGENHTVTASVGVSGDGFEITPAEGYYLWGTDGRLSYVDDTIAVAQKGGLTYRAQITEGVDFGTLNDRKLRNFVESIEGTAPARVPGEVGLAVTALTEAAYRADETGSTVQVERLIDEADG